MTRCEASSLVHYKRSQHNLKSPKGAELKEIKFEGGQEMRMTGILRLLKKDVPYRSRPKKPTNPEMMNMTGRIS